MYRIFQLPYHQQGWILAKAAQVVNHYGITEDALFNFFDTAFGNQPAIYNSATQDMTPNEVISLVSKWACQMATGVTTGQYNTGMDASNPVGNAVEVDARNMFKYGLLQDVFATPTVAIGGQQVGGLDTFDDYKAALDPLLA